MKYKQTTSLEIGGRNLPASLQGLLTIFVQYNLIKKIDL